MKKNLLVPNEKAVNMSRTAAVIRAVPVVAVPLNDRGRPGAQYRAVVRRCVFWNGAAA